MIETDADKSFRNIVLFLAFILGVPLSLWSAFVTTKLWGWYIVPVFHLAPLHLIQAAGLVMVVRFLTYDYNEDPNVTSADRNKKLFMNLWMAAFYPLIALGCGWAYHFFL